jgi:hypothetical protein
VKSQLVIAGLDPAIHLLKRPFAKKMDARIKSGMTTWYTR